MSYLWVVQKGTNKIGDRCTNMFINFVNFDKGIIYNGIFFFLTFSKMVGKLI